MAAEPAVSVRSLRKVYAGVPAVDDLSFDIAAGEVVALLGQLLGGGEADAVGRAGDHDRGHLLVLGRGVDVGPSNNDCPVILPYRCAASPEKYSSQPRWLRPVAVR